MNESNTSTAPSRSRRLQYTIGVPISIVVAAALAPSIIGIVAGSSLVASAVRSALPGASTVTVGSASFSWWGPQVISGISVSTEKGDRATIDLSIERGIASVVFGDLNGSTIALSGSAESRVLANGSLGLQALVGDALKSDESVGSFTLTVNGMDLKLRGENEADGSGSLHDLRGTIRLDGEQITLDVKGETEVNGKIGSIEVAGDVRMSKNASGMDIRLVGTQIPVPGAGLPIALRTVTARVRTDDLAKGGSIIATAEIDSGTEAAAKFESNIAFTRANENESPTLTGTLTLNQWPTTVLQPFLGDSFNLAEAFGPTADLALDATPDRATISVQSQYLSGSGTLIQQSKGLRFEGVDLRTTLAPSTLQALSGWDGLKSPTSVTIDAAFLDLGSPWDKKWSAEQISFEARIATGEASVHAFDVTDGMNPSIARWADLSIGWTESRLATVALGEGLQIEASGRVNAAPVELTCVLRELMTGSVVLERAHLAAGPLDTGTLPGIDSELASRFTRSGMGTITASADLESWGDPTRVRVTFDAIAANGATLIVRSADGSMQIGPVTAMGVVSNELLESWIDEPLPFQLAAPARVVVDVAPFTLSAEKAALPDRFEVHLRSESMALQSVKGIDGALQLSALDVTTSLATDPTKQSQVRVSSNASTMSGPIGQFTATASKLDGAVGAEWSIEASANIADGSRFAALTNATEASDLAHGAGTVKANVHTSPEGTSFHGEIAFANIRATADGRSIGPTTTINDLSVDLACDSASMASWMTGSDGSTFVKSCVALAQKDSVPVAFRCTNASIISSALVGHIDATVSIGPGALRFKGHEPILLSRLDSHFTSDDIVSGASFTVAGALGTSDSGSEPLSASGSAQFVRDAKGAIIGVRDAQAVLSAQGNLASALLAWNGENTLETSGIKSISNVSMDVRLKRSIFGVASADQSVAIDALIAPLTIALKSGTKYEVGPSTLSIAGERIGTKVTVTLKSAIAGPMGPAPIAAYLTAFDLGAPDKTLTLDKASFDGHLAASQVPMSMVDAVLQQKSSLAPALGDKMNLSLEALASQVDGRTSVDFTLDTPSLHVVAPSVAIQKGVVIVHQGEPAKIVFQMPTEFRNELLRGLNPILGDVTSAPPIVLQIESLSVPLDHWNSLSATGAVVTGDVTVLRHNQLLSLLKVTEPTSTIPAHIDPLKFKIDRGHLTYQDFQIGIGRYGASWKSILFLSGDIDLTKTPPYANSIVVGYPASSVARELTDVGVVGDVASKINQILQQIPASVGDSIRIKAVFSGPLGSGDKLKMTVQPEVQIDRMGEGVLNDLRNIFNRNNP